MMLVTGFMGSTQPWHDRGYVKRLEPHFTLIVVDPLGHGASDKPHDPACYTMATCVAHLAAILDHEGIERIPVWGFSRGAIIAAGMASLPEERRTCVILQGWPAGAGYASVADALRENEPLLAAGDWDSYFDRFPVPIPEPVRAMIRANNDPAALAAVSRAMTSHPEDWARTASDLSIPSLVIIGDQEPFLQTTLAEARHGGATVAVIENADHVGSSVAIDAVLDAVLPFLASQ